MGSLGHIRFGFNFGVVLAFALTLLSSLVDAWTINKQGQQPQHEHYDLVIVGAGSSGFSSCVAAGLLGRKTALIEANDHLGGDCTNSACVPSKALRSAAQQGFSLSQARQYTKDTVYEVRARENPEAVDGRNPNLDVFLVSQCHFVGSHLLKIMDTDNVTKTLHAKNFVIATGASPVVPSKWRESAAKAKLPLYTYRSLLSPEGNEMIWNMLSSTNDDTTSLTSQLLIVGGGATACELGQSLARLGRGQLVVHLVAPEILPQEDVSLRSAALRLLLYEGVRYHRHRLDNIRADQSVVLDSGKELGPVDVILVCIGRSPEASLSSLQLDQAGIKWDEQGVAVNPNTMESISLPGIYAVGDCADAIPPRSRCGAQAAWTGFHAVRNAVVPRFLTVGSRSINPYVPRVIYTSPELACVGMTQLECVQEYGLGGFDSIFCPELGSDRADMDRSARRTDLPFLELRVAKRGGKILGCTSCSPAAAEIANSMGMAITNHLTVRDLARSPHSYPSHGYILHRMALSLALSDIFGLIEACGPVGGVVASVGRLIQRLLANFRAILTSLFPWQRSRRERLRKWEAEAVRAAILAVGNDNEDDAQRGEKTRLVSFLDLYTNATLQKEVAAGNGTIASMGYTMRPTDLKAYEDWSRSKPHFEGN